MPRYFVRMAYAGTAYNGWQVQKNTSRTIQQVMNEKISGLLNEKVEFTGCGRTDTGVHAKEFFAHFDSQRNDLAAPLPDADEWMYKFNCVLPFDIAVYQIIRMNDDAHARYDAVSRTYCYLITQQRNPFLLERAYFVYADLDLDRMNAACELLLRYTDFTCFSKSNTQVKTNECKIIEAYWRREQDGDNLLRFTISADRFLRNMVRAIAGTMIDIGKKKISLGDFKKIIEGKKRSDAGMSVPAHGLYLMKVDYPEGFFTTMHKLKAGRKTK